MGISFAKVNFLVNNFIIFAKKYGKRDKIIVVGGGFAGLQFARKLNGKIEKKLMVIDKANHHMFQPLFYQVACGRIEPSNISFPFRKIFQRSKKHSIQND